MKSKQSTHDTINLGHTGLFHSTACFEAAGQLVLLKITAFISSFIPKPAEYTSYLFKNSTFCPHNVFMYFIWISEQTAIIFLYNINWLVSIT
jgi:hypothetical protein